MKFDYWRQHEPILIDFEDAWKNDPIPQLASFFAAVDVHIDSPNELLAELVMIDFEHRFNRNDIVDVTEYFNEFPVLREDAVLREELLANEFQLRKNAGKLPASEEIKKRAKEDANVATSYENLSNDVHQSLESITTPGAMVGQYRIVRRVGEGAFASVFSAVDTRLQRDVALKFLTIGDIPSPSRIRMRREAQAVATLQHPNIVDVFGAGNHLGYDYIVTRLVNGKTLSQQSKENSPNVDDAVRILIQLSSALEHAHQSGIIHRDIKPANVMIEDGVPLLLDFGLAHLVDSSQQLTHDGDLVGTPAFMPPEQADGRAWQADPRSDIYSLGAMLYLLVFRRLPFEGTTSEIISQIIKREPQVPRERSASVSRDLQTIILKCLQKEPTQRYQTATDLRDDLQSYLDGKPIVARPVGFTGRLWKWSRRRPVVASLLALVVALAVFGSGAASQLNQVTVERDRAQVAENETQALLAKSAADAGRLAIQRGKMKLAVQHFEQALDRGYEDRAELFLALVEANFALRQISDAEKYLAYATETVVDNQYLPELTLWRAELTLELPSKLEHSEDLFEKAQKMQLSLADQEYVNGILAEESLAAVGRFRTATELDPFHYRARRMLIFMLLSLARVDDASVQLRIARQLYPADQDFVILDSFSLAAQGSLNSAEEMIKKARIDDSLKEHCMASCQMLFELSNRDVELIENSDSLAWLIQLGTRFARDFGPIVRERNWRFPPRIGRRFTEFFKQLPELADGEEQFRADALEQLVAIHPEASLFLMLGALRLTDVDLFERGLDPANQIELLKQASASFKASLQHPGFIKQTSQRSWISLYTTSVILALTHQHEQEENIKEYIAASRQLEARSFQRPRRVRGMVITALRADDLAEADRWMERWNQLSLTSDDHRIDRLWHHAIIRQRHEDWLAIRTLCEEILKIDTDHSGAAKFHRKATGIVKKLLEADSK